jgi:ribosomal protein RSM22 (predicted rRNA methylase)
VRVPDAIERAIDREATAVPGKALARAAASLSDRYREPGRAEAPATHVLTEIERLAYAIVRAPATFAVASAVLKELRERAPALRFDTLLDLGAGPGAATWAALLQRDDLQQATLIEQDRGFIDLGRRLLESAALRSSVSIEWRCADLKRVSDMPVPPHDLVIMSYALGEVGAAAIARAWAATRQVLVVIEPGTPFHFGGVLAAREQLIAAGAFIAAPCPHALACPMAGTDWCHMAARVERTSLHRRLKGAELPYEDEKFSYVIATKTPVERAAARVVRRPDVQKGFVALTLCTPEGLQRQGVPRSQREAFKRARKVAWGEAW